MNDKANISSFKNVFRLIDLFVVVFFLFTASVSVYMFRADLMRTIENRDETPAGIIIIRNNVVQRRYADRVIWERLFVDSPVYSGDLIRAADLSAATIHVDENQISLNENTLIRVQHSSNGVGPLEVELREGNISVATASGANAGSGAGIVLSLMGRQVHIESGTVLNAEFGEEGIIVKVSEGSAVFVEEGQKKELTEGMMIAQDTSGAERIIPAAVVTSFGTNARYLKHEPEPLPIDFGWNNVNIEEGETVRLEIAGDRNFTRDLQVLEGLDDHAQAVFDEGLWYWRLALGDVVLSSGQLTVAEAVGPELLSPVMNSVFRYYRELPQIRFQWSQKSGASHYILEAAGTPDFENLKINRQVSSSSFIHSNLEAGTWYWRVLPVFPSAYEGSAVYSSVSFFTIEQSAAPQAVTIEVPEPVLPNEPVSRRTYIVQPGDTLRAISIKAYGFASGWQDIVEANNINNPDLIFIEQILYIP